MKQLRTLVAAFATIVMLTSGVLAASIPLPGQSGAPYAPPYDPSALGSYLQLTLQATNQWASGYQPLNYLDNGFMTVQQRGTGTATCGGTSGPASTAYGADRWACEVNVGSQQGRQTPVTSASGVTFAPSVANMTSLFRNANALTQPICLEQEIETARFTQLQGRPVILSAWLAANTGAPSGVTATFYLWTGTSTNEGLGASTIFGSAIGMTASPALTPAMTGIATAGSYTTPALTTTATRYSSAPILVPTTATEGVAAICWTPGAETAGSTDGILIGAAQLEEAEGTQTTAGRIERVPAAEDLARSQRFFWQITDPAATVEVPSACFVTAANTTVKCGVWLPQPMIAAPITTASGATASFGIVVTAGSAGTCTALNATASSNTTRSIGVTCTTGGTIALGSATPLIGAATTQTLSASADF